MTDPQELVRRRLFDFSKAQSARSLSICMCPWELCNRKAINAHSIQNAHILDALQRRGHVVMPRLRTSMEGKPDIRFEEVGRNRATAFFGLCANHDAQLFRPIESGEINLENLEHLFLIAYRAALKEAHVSLKAGIDVQSSFLKGAELGLFPRDDMSLPGMLAVKQMMAAHLVHQVRLRFDKVYLAKTWAAVTHTVIHIDAPACIAANSLFSTNLWSQETDSLALICLNVLPYRNNTVAIFSSLVEHVSQLRTTYSKVLSSTSHYQRYELSKLMLKKCENLVIAPLHFERLPNHQKLRIVEFFMSNIGENELDFDDPSLDIFTPYFVSQ